MNNVTVLGLIFGVIIGVIATIVVVIPMLKKKGIDVPKCLDGGKEGLEIASKTVDVVGEVLPDNKTVLILKTIIEWAKLAVGNSEQLWISNDLDKDKRKEAAQNVIYTMLKELGIEITDSRKTLIDAAIHYFVKELGHQNKTEAEKQVILENLQTKLNEKTQENANLNQIITQIKGTIALPEAQQ